MNRELPLPDGRLNGKIMLEQVLPIKRDLLHLASSDGEKVETAPHLDLSGQICRLAGLGKRAYELERLDAAKRLSFRTSVLDDLVAAERDQTDNGNKQGRALTLPEPEPWPHPVNGADLLNELSMLIRQYVVMQAYAADTVALWVLHTYLIGGFGISPRLAITSPEKRCGKTTLLDVLSHLVMRPLPTANVTAAAIFRVVEMRQPTLLIDEADTFLSEDHGLRGILNSGHRQGGSVIRIVGEDLEPRCFSTYSALAIACIGKLPATLTDRSLSIDLRRRRRDEPIDAYRFDRTNRLDQIASQIMRWARDNSDQVCGADPELPPNLFNRAADNWRPLLAIADAAGDRWPARARHAVQAAGAASGDHDESTRVALLADIRTIFAERGMDRLASAELVEALVAIEGHPWAECRAGKPITQSGVARLVTLFGIKPETIRIGDRTPKGYMLAQFEDAFARYLPATAQQTP